MDRFGEQLTAAGAAHRRTALAVVTPSGRVRVGLMVAAVLLVLAAAAAAAGVFATGTPVGPPAGEPLRPTVGHGTPVPGSVVMLPVSVPDPVGGPAWGLRYETTTRGYGCLQVGRLSAGQIGVLGQDRAFGDDGRFHPLPPGVLGDFQCAELDAAGHAYLAVGLPSTASAFPAIPCGSGRDAGKLPRCPKGDPRILYYGLLGANAVAVTYRKPSGTLRTVPTVGAQGAYLVVEAPAHAPRQFEGAPEASPLPPIVAVTYRRGHVCQTGLRGGCPPVGYVAPSDALPSAATARAPLSLRMTGPAHHTIQITLRAPVSVNSAASIYGIAVTTLAAAQSRHCNSAGSTGANQLDRGVTRGETIQLSYELDPECPRERVHVQILLSSRSLRPGAFGPALLLEDGAGATRVVGERTITVKAPRR
jgi:hypothetical protein